jgi:hypothetical protein
MSDPTLAKILRDVGLARAIQPPDTIRQLAATKTVIDETGAINPPAAAPFRTPQTMHFPPGAVGRQRVSRAGTLSLVSAYATTPPGPGNATITVTAWTADGGTQTIATLTIPAGSEEASITPQVAVPAGARILAAVTTASGAAGVSIDLDIRTG